MYRTLFKMFWVRYQQVSGKADKSSLFPKIRLLVNSGERCHVVAVSVLKAITEKRVIELNELGIAAATIGESPKIDEEVLEGKYEVVFWQEELDFKA